MKRHYVSAQCGRKKETKFNMVRVTLCEAKSLKNGRYSSSVLVVLLSLGTSLFSVINGAWNKAANSNWSLGTVVVVFQYGLPVARRA